VRESRTPGSARGVLSNGHSYRNIQSIRLSALPHRPEGRCIPRDLVNVFGGWLRQRLLSAAR
jgi:hypothetical protein